MTKMKRIYVVVSLGGLLSGVESKLLRWANDKRDAEWKPAQATMAYDEMLNGHGMSPKPTPAPRAPGFSPDRSLDKRASTDNTCAYISGITASSLYCDPDNACVFNSRASAIGCCADTLLNVTTTTGTSVLCPVPTTCYDSTESPSFSTANGLTIYCGESNFPTCVKHLYKDPVWTGYTLWGCHRSLRTDFVYYEPTTLGDSTSASNTRTRTPTSSDEDGTSTSGSAANESATNPPTPSPSPVPPPAKKSNTGAIVGGVVGGVAAIAIIGLAAFFLLRRKKKPSAATPAAAAAGPGTDPTSPTGPASPPPQGGYYDPNQPQMAQQQGQYNYGAAGFAPVDPRASIAKPPYAVATEYNPHSPNANNGFSPPQSPAPAYGPPGSTPPPAGAYGQQQAAVSPDSTGYGQPGQPYQATQYNQYGQQPPQQAQPYGQQGQQGHPTEFAAELPTQRGDGEVRELA
ncbi:hypothetical protein GE09DRAFT_212947 [Coniochaeta sp. 2T2.1]|nr:hypothetical protein GE09DRAFT_212947 [Coniochaeta sp. 2T2.1]